MYPLFVHDPRAGEAQSDRFILAGNPNPGDLWVRNRLSYVDENGKTVTMNVPLTPADYALGEARFARQFRPLRDADEAGATPIHEYVELEASDRIGKVPFVYTTDADDRLVRVVCSSAIVELVEDRRRNWEMLQYLAGQPMVELKAEHTKALADLKAQFEKALEDADA